MSSQEEIADLIKSKSSLKRDVIDLSVQRFKELKEILQHLIHELEEDVSKKDPRLEFSFLDLGEHYAQITIAGDVLLFALHTNVFYFPNENPYWQSSYLKEDNNRGFCGTIQVYNFLADSVRFNREHDLGYLLARLFVNVDNHFFVEGKTELGLLFNNFVYDELTKEKMREVVLSIIKYCLNFDLYVPHYNHVAQITLGDANTMKNDGTFRTGKRLGFQFGMDEDPPS